MRKFAIALLAATTALVAAPATAASEVQVHQEGRGGFLGLKVTPTERTQRTDRQVVVPKTQQDRAQRADSRRDRQVVTPPTVSSQAYRNGTYARTDRQNQNRYEQNRRYGQNQGYGQNRTYSRDDWRQHRQANRSLYSRGQFRSPYAYQTFRPGFSISFGLTSSNYTLDAGRYRLPNPGYGYQWVRHYDDVLLVDVRRRMVVDVIHNFFW